LQKKKKMGQDVNHPWHPKVFYKQQRADRQTSKKMRATRKSS
jgi:hypothetical protein